jgi:S1-C subfamily serine protease
MMSRRLGLHALGLILWLTARPASAQVDNTVLTISDLIQAKALVVRTAASIQVAQRPPLSGMVIDGRRILTVARVLQGPEGRLDADATEIWAAIFQPSNPADWGQWVEVQRLPDGRRAVDPIANLTLLAPLGDVPLHADFAASLPTRDFVRYPLRVGEPVIVAGLQNGNPSIRDGSISHVERLFDGQSYVEHDAPCNPDGAGGPVYTVRKSGARIVVELIGVNVRASELFDFSGKPITWANGLTFALTIPGLRSVLVDRWRVLR